MIVRHMNGNSKISDIDSKPLLQRSDFRFGLLLFVVAAVSLFLMTRDSGLMASGHGWGTALFFFLYGLFTITMGYSRPGFGHVSFDRVAQVASLLILGPVDAAWINGLASLIYPWHRLRAGVPLPTVLTAALHNSGLMTLVILASGSLYVFLGGPIPLDELSLSNAGLLLLLMLSMQLLNDLSMTIIMRLRDAAAESRLNVLSTTVEIASILMAILLALIYMRMETSVLVLTLLVSSLGMALLKQFARMHYRLEALVDERTEELRIKSLELERQATHDKLTGLFNRRYADDFLQREIDASQRHNRDFTIALADVDHFKRINDRFSHAVGDEVLCRIAKILVDRCRKTDVVARYGGEEFLLCFPDTSSQFAEQICGQIRTAVERADWSGLAEQGSDDIRITISFGVAEVGNDTRRTTILSDADTRLYQAKHGGRNRIIA